MRASKTFLKLLDANGLPAKTAAWTWSRDIKCYGLRFLSVFQIVAPTKNWWIGVYLITHPPYIYISTVLKLSDPKHTSASRRTMVFKIQLTTRRIFHDFPHCILTGREPCWLLEFLVPNIPSPILGGLHQLNHWLRIWLRNRVLPTKEKEDIAHQKFKRLETTALHGGPSIQTSKAISTT